MGRFLGLPYFLAIVPTRSMEPSIRPLDIVVIERTQDVSIGDIVLWCTTVTHCVLHRVVNITSGGVITKGDNNPVPDAGPIPFSRIIGKAVAVVPREFTLSILGLFIGYFVYYALGSLVRRGVSVVVLMLVFYLLLSFGLVAVTPTALSTTIGAIKKPWLVVSRIEVTDNGSIVVVFSSKDMRVAGIHECSVFVVEVKEGGEKEVVARDTCNATFADNEVEISVNKNLFAIAAMDGARIAFSIIVSFEPGGWLRGSGYVPYPVHRLCIRTVNGTIRVYNPNFYPVWIVAERPEIVRGRVVFETLWKGWLDGKKTLVLDFSNKTNASIRIRYMIQGKEIVYDGAVMLHGKPVSHEYGPCRH